MGDTVSPIQKTLLADVGTLISYWRDTVSYLGDTRWNPPRGVSQNVETVPPILEIVSLIWAIQSPNFGETLSRERGEFQLLSPIVKTLSADVGILLYLLVLERYLLSLIWRTLSLQFLETPRRGEFHLILLRSTHTLCPDVQRERARQDAIPIS